MTAFLFVLWVAFVLASYSVLFLVQIPLRKGSSAIVKVLVFLVKIVLFVVNAFISISIITKITWNVSYLFGAIYVALAGDILSDVVSFVVHIIRRDRVGIRLQAIFGLVLTLGFLTYGTLNMETVRANELTFRSDKIKTQHRFVFFSDLHYGSAQTPKLVERTIREIVSQKPDFIVMGGDITDDLSKKREMEEIYSLLGSTGIPTYYVYGNHDRQSNADLVGGADYTPEELERTLQANGITILKDSWVRISDDLVLLGREDASESSRVSVDELPDWPDDAYTVCIDHSPYQTEDIVRTKADLQLSGHTHAGQFFPLQIVYNLTGHEAYGFYHHGDTDVYVSSGISGWLFPFRTEAHCNYEIVTLVP